MTLGLINRGEGERKNESEREREKKKREREREMVKKPDSVNQLQASC